MRLNHIGLGEMYIMTLLDKTYKLLVLTYGENVSIHLLDFIRIYI